MRAAVFAERVLSLPTDGVTALLAVVLDDGRAGLPDGKMAMRALTDALGDAERIPYIVRADWYQAAAHNGHDSVCKLLLELPPFQSLPREVIEEIAPGVDTGIPLGRRKSQARSTDRITLERLLLDPEPSVIKNLLQNPALTEDWVLRIATRRPNLPDVMRQIAKVPRWFDRYWVRVAIARNPYSPTGLAIRVIPGLNRQELREIAADGTLHIEVREAARLASERRG